MGDISSIDLYGLLDILSSATAQQVKKAYRKKALQCHPDKNPDNPKAAELFHQLSKALEILTDETARAAYDKVLNAKKAAALRNKELDSRRKKLKEDLEARERLSQFEKNQEKTAEAKFKAEFERLQKEGSKQVEEEVEYVRLQVQREQFCNIQEADPSLYRLKINWKLNSDMINDPYNQESLKKFFSKYGEISALVVSSKKKGSALLEFSSLSAAIRAQQLERGVLSNPLSVNWLNGCPPGVASYRNNVQCKTSNTGISGTSAFPSVSSDKTAPTKYKTFPCFPLASQRLSQQREVNDDVDFETAVLSKMRQAEEEKRKATENELKEKT